MFRALLKLLLVAAVAAFGPIPHKAADKAEKAIETDERQSYASEADCVALQTSLAYFAEHGTTEISSKATYVYEKYDWRRAQDEQRLIEAMAGTTTAKPALHDGFEWGNDALEYIKECYGGGCSEHWLDSYDYYAGADLSAAIEHAREAAQAPPPPPKIDVVFLEYSIAMAITSGVSGSVVGPAETKLHDALLARLDGGGATAAACIESGPNAGGVTVVNVGCYDEVEDVMYAVSADGAPASDQSDAHRVAGATLATAAAAATELQNLCNKYSRPPPPPTGLTCGDLAGMVDVRAVAPGVSSFYFDPTAVQDCGSDETRLDSPELCEASYELVAGPWTNAALTTFTARKCRYIAGNCVADTDSDGSATCNLPDTPDLCKKIDSDSNDYDASYTDTRPCFLKKNGFPDRDACNTLSRDVNAYRRRAGHNPIYPNQWEWCGWIPKAKRESPRKWNQGACEAAYATRHVLKTDTSFTVQPCVMTSWGGCRAAGGVENSECLRKDIPGNVPSEQLIARWIWRMHLEDKSLQASRRELADPRGRAELAEARADEGPELEPYDEDAYPRTRAAKARELDTASMVDEYSARCRSQYCLTKGELTNQKCYKIELGEWSAGCAISGCRPGKKVKWWQVPDGTRKDAIATAIVYNNIGGGDACTFGHGGNDATCWTNAASASDIPLRGVVKINC